MILDKKISEIMQVKVVTAESNTTIHDIACLMDQKNIGSVLISDNDTVRGIITERDITHQLYKGNNLSKIPASQLMIKEIISATPETTIGEAIKILFKNKFRRLPIIKNNRLIGIITSTDICYEINNPHASTTVGEIMRKDVPTISGEKTVYKAIDLMLKKKSSTGRMGVGSIVITIEDRVEGIVTEKDIIKYVVAKNKDVKKTKVSEIMSPNIITIKPDVLVCHAAELLSTYGFRHLPVLDEEDRLAGIVTQTDLIAELKREYESNAI
jgi:CBS domain-containing protein